MSLKDTANGRGVLWVYINVDMLVDKYNTIFIMCTEIQWTFILYTIQTNHTTPKYFTWCKIKKKIRGAEIIVIAAEKAQNLKNVQELQWGRLED